MKTVINRKKERKLRIFTKKSRKKKIHSRNENLN